MQAIVPVGIGIILMIAGIIYQKTRVAAWMEARRIDGKKKQKENTCGVCGSKMKLRTAQNGRFAGKSMLVCSRWPDCRKIEWPKN